MDLKLNERQGGLVQKGKGTEMEQVTAQKIRIFSG